MIVVDILKVIVAPVVSPDALPVILPLNPFDAAPGQAVNPFDATPEIAPMHGNPFAPTIPGNPFDAQPANPFN